MAVFLGLRGWIGFFSVFPLPGWGGPPFLPSRIFLTSPPVPIVSSLNDDRRILRFLKLFRLLLFETIVEPLQPFKVGFLLFPPPSGWLSIGFLHCFLLFLPLGNASSFFHPWLIPAWLSADLKGRFFFFVFPTPKPGYLFFSDALFFCWFTPSFQFLLSRRFPFMSSRTDGGCLLFVT